MCLRLYWTFWEVLRCVCVCVCRGGGVGVGVGGWCGWVVWVWVGGVGVGGWCGWVVWVWMGGVGGCVSVVYDHACRVNCVYSLSPPTHADCHNWSYYI